jgi:hypothetical protein
MTYETTTTQTMTNRDLAEAIVDDRIAHRQFGEADRDWLVEREMRETRESLVSAFNAIERWDDTDTDDDTDDFMWDEMEQEEAHGPLFDGNLGQLLGEFEWQYDTDAIADMITVYDHATCQTYHRLEDDMPEWEEVDHACMWTPIVENVEHILDWYNLFADTSILDVDVEKVLDALTEEKDGELVWKPLSGRQVEDIIYDLALVTSDNMGTLPADEIDSDHIEEMWEVLSWADATPLWIDSDDEEETLGKIWFAMTTDHETSPVWKPIKRSQVAEIVDYVLG